MIIAIDFDGTIVDHRFPDIGKPVPWALSSMRKLQELGAKLILNTMRSGESLDAAVEYCRSEGIEFWGVNENPQQKSWTSSPKVYAHIYVDDAAYGCPMIERADFARPAVDWGNLGADLVCRQVAENNKVPS